jgi:hypothetical protein
MAGSEITTLFGPPDRQSWTDADRAAFAKGYQDYQQHAGEESPSIVRPAFDPPPGHEPAYQAGWDQAKAEDDDARRTAAIGLA